MANSAASAAELSDFNAPLEALELSKTETMEWLGPDRLRENLPFRQNQSGRCNLIDVAYQIRDRTAE